MKALVGIAVVLGIVGTVLGVIAVTGGDAFDEKTLELTGSNEERIDFKSDSTDPAHRLDAWTSARDISGDATGRYVVTCIPLVKEEIECSGAFLLEDGDIEVESTEIAEDDGEASAALVGGTGSYKGATGELTVDFENDAYKLDLLIPSQ